VTRCLDGSDATSINIETTAKVGLFAFVSDNQGQSITRSQAVARIADRTA